MMRLTAVLFLFCVVALGSFGGLVKPAQTKMDCCKGMSCHNPASAQQKEDSGQPCCPVICTFNTVGFFPMYTFALQSPHAGNSHKPVARLVIGDLSAYHADNWKPPKSC